MPSASLVIPLMGAQGPNQQSAEKLRVKKQKSIRRHIGPDELASLSQREAWL